LDGNFKIILEDAHRSGFHRPHWKYHVWIESKEGFQYILGNKFLYAVIFYDSEGEFKIKIDEQGKLDIVAGPHVKDILYPWAKGTIGRGNPYHEIEGSWPSGEKGIRYFDDQGFVGFQNIRFND
jgi:hypothetical protein